MPFRECTLRSSKQNEVCAFLNSSSTHFPLFVPHYGPDLQSLLKKDCISIQDKVPCVKTHETQAFLSHIILASAGVCSHS